MHRYLVSTQLVPLFLKTMNIEAEIRKYPKSDLRDWSHSAIYCLKRSCICYGCMYGGKFETLKPCKMKVAVFLLTKKFGAPTKKRLELYDEIERGIVKNERKFKLKNSL